MIGEICLYPKMKKIIIKTTCIVTFFNISHYWEGQLKQEAQKLKINCMLKKNCETRFYALSLQCASVLENQYVFMIKLTNPHNSYMFYHQECTWCNLCPPKGPAEDQWTVTSCFRCCGNHPSRCYLLAMLESVATSHKTNC
jgi:hypothetical protein